MTSLVTSLNEIDKSFCFLFSFIYCLRREIHKLEFIFSTYVKLLLNEEFTMFVISYQIFHSNITLDIGNIFHVHFMLQVNLH